MRIEETDITKLKVDAIVNAANAELGGGTGVNGAIQRAAGPALLKACLALGGCATGDAKATPGFKLPAKYVFHAVGPIWSGGRNREPELLASCYNRVMDLAAEYGVTSLAVPAISCGVYGYPVDLAARIAIDTLRARQPQSAVEEIIVALIDPEALSAYRAVLD